MQVDSNKIQTKKKHLGKLTQIVLMTTIEFNHVRNFDDPETKQLFCIRKR